LNPKSRARLAASQRPKLYQPGCLWPAIGPPGKRTRQANPASGTGLSEAARDGRNRFRKPTGRGQKRPGKPGETRSKRTKAWTTRKGQIRGGRVFSKTRLQELLTNTLYTGHSNTNVCSVRGLCGSLEGAVDSICHEMERRSSLADRTLTNKHTFARRTDQNLVRHNFSTRLSRTIFPCKSKGSAPNESLSEGLQNATQFRSYHLQPGETFILAFSKDQLRLSEWAPRLKKSREGRASGLFRAPCLRHKMPTRGV
jgi:hypothetical protein